MAKLNVGKWQAARRKPMYTPTLQFFYRQLWLAMFEAMRVKGVGSPYLEADQWATDGIWFFPINELPPLWKLWDAAIMARDWIARSAPDPRVDRHGWILSFDAACLALGCHPDTERLQMLERIDAAADFDTDEVWARIEHLTANPPDEEANELLDEDGKPLFDAPRVVPALDQGNLFAMMQA